MECASVRYFVSCSSSSVAIVSSSRWTRNSIPWRPGCNLHKPLMSHLRLTSPERIAAPAAVHSSRAPRPLPVLRLGNRNHWGVVFLAAIHSGLRRPARMLCERNRCATGCCRTESREGSGGAEPGGAEPGHGRPARERPGAQGSDRLALAAGLRLPARHVALGEPDGPEKDADPGTGPRRDARRAREGGGDPLEAAGPRGPPEGAAASAPESVPLHPSLRGQLDRRRRPVLRRPSDGPRLPGGLRPLAPSHQGHGRSLDAPRADLGGRKGGREQGFLPLAEHGEVLRPDLTPHLPSP